MSQMIFTETYTTIFTLLSSGRKNYWEGNEHANQMLKNT